MENGRPKFSLNQTFSALKHRNFRLFWFGQAVSLIGTWMQNIAQAWLVLELTKSAFWLGVVSALQFTPMLLFSLYAGTIVDRFPKQKVLVLTQTVSAILAFTLAIDTQLHTVALWHVLITATLLGLTNTLDVPTRQSFIIELVGKQDLPNAILLNSTIFNAARILGPSIAGLVIAKFGMNFCFYLNAFSFIPVIAGITLIRFENKSFSPAQPMPVKKGSTLHDIKEGLHYVFKTPIILILMILLAVVNTFAFNFYVLLPLYARNIFKTGAQGFGFLMSAFGVGALAGSIILASRSGYRPPAAKTIIIAAIALCFFELLIVPIKTPLIVYVLLALAGFSLIAFSATTNSLIQLQTPDHLRGRVMSIFTLVFVGFNPIASFLSGLAANAWGAPVALGLGAAISLGFIAGIVLRYYAILKDGIY